MQLFLLHYLRPLGIVSHWPEATPRWEWSVQIDTRSMACRNHRAGRPRRGVSLQRLGKWDGSATIPTWPCAGNSEDPTDSGGDVRTDVRIQCAGVYIQNMSSPPVERLEKGPVLQQPHVDGTNYTSGSCQERSSTKSWHFHSVSSLDLHIDYIYFTEDTHDQSLINFYT